MILYNLDHQIDQIISELNIDYSKFSVEHILERVESLTLWKVKIHQLDLKQIGIDADGAYLKELSTKTNHILYGPVNDSRRTHVIFHEIGHILFGHKTWEVDVLDQLDLAKAALRSTQNQDKSELEAETFAIRLQASSSQNPKSSASDILSKLL